MNHTDSIIVGLVKSFWCWNPHAFSCSWERKLKIVVEIAKDQRFLIPVVKNNMLPTKNLGRKCAGVKNLK